MARSPDMAAAKDAAAAADAPQPAAEATKADPKYLRGPDGYVYVHTATLAKEPGFFPYSGKIDKRGFAVDQQ